MMLRRHVPHVAAIRLVVVGDRDEESAVAGDDRRPGAAGPSPDLVIVACADVDLDPLAVLGLRPGDAHLVTTPAGAGSRAPFATSRRPGAAWASRVWSSSNTSPAPSSVRARRPRRLPSIESRACGHRCGASHGRLSRCRPCPWAASSAARTAA